MVCLNDIVKDGDGELSDKNVTGIAGHEALHGRVDVKDEFYGVDDTARRSRPPPSRSKRRLMSGHRAFYQTAAALGLLALGSLSAAPAHAAGDRALGEYLAAECAGCHQSSGRQQGGIPAITGWPEDRFIAAIAAYTTKQRENQVMAAIAGRLSQDEVTALAAYYGSLAVSR